MKSFHFFLSCWRANQATVTMLIHTFKKNSIRFCIYFEIKHELTLIIQRGAVFKYIQLNFIHIAKNMCKILHKIYLNFR
jgi:hypothetical protein